MVSIATWVAVVALAPVTLGRYGLAGHDLWLACSIPALILLLGTWAVNYRTPEIRQEFTAYSRARLLREGATYGLLLVAVVVALSLVALGLVPDQEPALYLTAVVLGLLGTAVTGAHS